MTRFLMAVAAMGLVCAALRADESVEIKLGAQKAGDTARVTRIKSSKMDAAAIAADFDQKHSEAGSEKYVYIETILEKPDPKKKETKATRLYETAEKTKDGKAVWLTFVKKTVAIEKKDGKYAFAVDGRPLPPEEEAIFKKEYADETSSAPMEEFLPVKPVKVGEEWKIDMAKVFEKKNKAEEFPFTIDGEKSKAIAKLVKVYMQDGHRYGVMELAAEIPLKTMKFGTMPKDLKAGSKMTMKLQVDTCIDGSMPYGTGTMSVQMDAAADLSGNGTMTVKGGEEGTMKVEKVK